MREIVVPKPIKLVHPVTGAELEDKPLEFQSWLLGSPLNDAKLGTSYEDLEMVRDLRDAVRASHGVYIRIESERAWQRVCDVIQKPTNPYIPAIAVQIFPFFDAWLDAPHVKA